MKNWTIGKRITLGFLLVILVSSAVGGLSVLKVRNLRKQINEIVDVWSPSYVMMADLSRSINGAQIALLENMTTEDAAETKRLNDAVLTNLATVEKTLVRYKEEGMITVEVGEQPLYDKTWSTFKAFQASITQTLALATANKNEEAAALYWKEVLPNAVASREALLAQAELNRTQLVESGKDGQNLARLTIIFVISGTLASMALGIVFAWGIIRSTNKALQQIAITLNDAATQVAAAAGQVSSSSQSLAEGSSEQAASLEETSASLEEIGSMTKRNADSAENARAISIQTTQATETGTRQMDEMVASMGAIKASSDNIAKIIKTIDEIAFQTNILALNAAVEAARAGEAGAGFAVVADEVRALAQRAAQAARETTEKIDDSITKSGQGLEISGRVAADLKQITDKTREVNALVVEIAAASKEQNQGLGQVSTAISQMDKVTQSNAGTAEESAAAAEELNAQSVSMKESVSDLLRLVGGARRDDTAPITPGVLKKTKSPVLAVHTPSVKKAITKPESRLAHASAADGDFFKDS
jgi:methyl-accepting chemotaxis protein